MENGGRLAEREREEDKQKRHNANLTFFFPTNVKLLSFL
jgi:hypothetical protein